MTKMLESLESFKTLMLAVMCVAVLLLLRKMYVDSKSSESDGDNTEGYHTGYVGNTQFTKLTGGGDSCYIQEWVPYKDHQGYNMVSPLGSRDNALKKSVELGNKSGSVVYTKWNNGWSARGGGPVTDGGFQSIAYKKICHPKPIIPKNGYEMFPPARAQNSL